MESLAFHLFVVGTVILLCALMTVVVHSFVADSSLLDCCDLGFFCFVCLIVLGVFSTLYLQVGNRLGC